MSEIKEKIFAKMLDLVSRHGIRMMSMDSLAREMGVSKKTIYHFYSNKEALIVDCVAHIISGLNAKLQPVINNGDHPLVKIADLYAHCLDVVLQFPGAFFNDLRKLHPAANKLLQDFREHILFATVLALLKEAKERDLLIPGINMQFVCEIHFYRILELVDNLALRTSLQPGEILRTLILTNLRGVLKAEHMQVLDNYTPKRG